MAVGDPVIAWINGASGYGYFQPAGSTVVLICSFESNTFSSGADARRYDGANATLPAFQALYTSPYSNPFTVPSFSSKILIDNSVYWGMYSTGYTAISGFEVA